MTARPNASPPHRSAQACRVNPFLDAGAHLSLAEVAECERLAVRRQTQFLSFQDTAQLRDLLRKRHRPLYDHAPPPAPEAA